MGTYVRYGSFSFGVSPLERGPRKPDDWCPRMPEKVQAGWMPELRQTRLTRHCGLGPAMATLRKTDAKWVGSCPLPRRVMDFARRVTLF